MRTRVFFLLSISLLATAANTRAAGRSEVVHHGRTASLCDTSHVFSTYTWDSGLPRWVRRDRFDRDLEVIHPLTMGAPVPLPGMWRAHDAESPPPDVDPSLYGADGNVLGVTRTGNTLYIAGSFRSVGENRGGCVSFDIRGGQILPSFPKVAGSVYAIVPDGLGGWYLGGEFSGVGGKPRSCLAQVRADGSVSDWNPNVSGSPGYIALPAVEAIAVRGDRVFVGGAFRFIGGQPRMDLGCVDARTGAVLDWVADAPEDGFVRALALQGDTLFVGGGFSSLGGAPRSSLAAVDAITAGVLPWRMDVFGGAYALLASADTLYVGGDFLAIGGRSQPILAAADIPSALVLPIDFRASGITQTYVPPPQVDGLAKAGNTLYAVGNFTNMGGQVRSGIAALDATTGDATAWSPDTTGPHSDGFPPPLCLTVGVAGGAVYVGGYFGLVNGAYHPYLAAWDRQTGRVLDWTPAPDDAPLAFAASGETLQVGGYFHMVGEWQHRAGLAAIDLTTGRLKAWNPNPNGGICTAIAMHDDRALVSGDFSIIGGDPQPHNYFAALDTINGEATSWDPGANDLAEVLLVAGDTLFAGGDFTQVGSQPRNAAAAIDARTGAVLPWDPNVNQRVLAISRSGNTVFLGGVFTQVGGQQRFGLAAVDAFSGALDPWNPGTDNSTVDAVLVRGDVLYVGGAFGMIGGQPRKALAAVDLQTGQPTAWRPVLTEWDVVDPRVRALALVDSVLYVGGSFASIGGQPRICLGGVDVTTGLATGWNPGTDGLVWSLAVSGNVIYAGGGFSRAGGIPADGLAAFTLAQSPLPPPTSLELACVPNPVRTSAEIRFGLPSAAAVTIAVYDLQGRRIAAPANHSLMNAGQHAVQIQTQGWRPGVYLYRLDVGGQTASRKMLVLR